MRQPANHVSVDLVKKRAFLSRFMFVEEGIRLLSSKPEPRQQSQKVLSGSRVPNCLWRCVTFLIVLTAVYQTNPSGAIAGQARNCTDQHSPVLVIGDFEMIEGAADTRFISQGLAQILQFVLLSEPQIGVVSRPCLWRTLMDMQMALPSESGEEIYPQRIFEPDVLRNVGAEFFLTGTFLELERSFQFQARLEALPFHDVILKWDSSIDYASTMSVLEDLADQIAKALSDRPVPSYKPATLIVSCFRDEFGDRSEQSAAIGQDLGRFVAHVLGNSGILGLVVARWNREDAGCTRSPPAIAAEIARVQGKDLVIGGAIGLKDETLSIYPEILVAEHGTIIQLPFVKGPVADYPLLREKVGRSGIDYARKIVGRGGKGSFEELVLANTGPGREFEQGKVLFEQKDYELAEPFFQQALKIRPDFSEAHRYLGRIYLGQGRTKEAIEEFQLGAAANSQDPLIFQDLGEAWLRIGELSSAKDAYLKSLKFDDMNGTIHKRLGLIHQLEENFDAARNHYEDAHKVSPDDPEPLVFLARLDLKKSDFERALDHFKDALAIDPENGEAVDGILNVYHWNGRSAWLVRDFAEAETQFSLEIEFRRQIGQPSALPYFMRAISRTAPRNPSWNIDGAIADYEEVLEMNGRTDTGLSADVEWTALGLLELYVMAERYDDAQQLGWDQIKLFSSKPFLRPVARFYRIAAMIMTGKKYGVQMEILREELASLKSSYKDQSYVWKFENFIHYVEMSENFEPNQKSSILKLALLLKEADPIKATPERK